MNENEILQQQLADIGRRYLKRTLGELEHLRELVASVRGPAGCGDEAEAASAAVLQQVAQLAHQICGSGAMFGFDKLSEQAREVERLAIAGDAPSRSRLPGAVAELEEQALAAARARNVE